MTKPLAVLAIALVFVPYASGTEAAVQQDRQELLAQLGAAPPADPEKPPPSRPCPDPPCFDPSAGRTPTAFLNWVARDVAAFWRERVEGIPYGWSPGRQLVIAPRRQRRSACSKRFVSSDAGPFYCAADRPPTVFLPLEGMRKRILRRPNWQRWRKQDFALAYVVAHEWGHHLQKVVRILQDSKLKSIQIELQADCLAGVWSHSVWARMLLEPGDIKEAVALARLAGDRPGTPKNDPRAHGSAQQRETWFKRGYETGQAANCIVPSP